MSLWNSFAFTTAGEPTAPTAPPALRVNGGQATAAQLSMAQAAFSRFCEAARLSAAPNPTAAGSLEDGTRYRIVTMGAQTVMEIWPVQGGEVFGPGIGVAVGGKIWSLHPPSNASGPGPGPGKWGSKVVKDLNGGYGYTYNGSTKVYFVESANGVSAGNKKLAPPLHGLTHTLYLRPTESSYFVDVSRPFLRGNRVYQARVTGGSLTVKSKPVEGAVLGDGTTEQSIPLPAGSGVWGLLSASNDGASIVACRLKDDAGSWYMPFQRVDAYTTLGAGPDGFTPPTLQPVATTLSRLPNVEGSSAPKYGTFSREEQYSSFTTTHYVASPNPYSPGGEYVPGSTTTRSRSYLERSSFTSTGVLRKYVGAGGEVLSDGYTATDEVTISDTGSGGQSGFFSALDVSYSESDNEEVQVNVARRLTVDMASVGPLDVLKSDITYNRKKNTGRILGRSFGFYRYNEAGEVIGWVYVSGGSARDLLTYSGSASFEVRKVMFHDPEFSAAVAVVARATASVNGVGGHDTVSSSDEDSALYNAIWNGEGIYSLIDPINIYSFDSTQSVTLEVLTESGKVERSLSPPGGFASAVRTSGEALFNSLQVVRSRAPAGSSGFVENRIQAEEALIQYLGAVLTDLVKDVMYAKDPKTGAGFLSYSVGGSTENQVVGPWGFRSASAVTPVAGNAKPTAIQSI